MDWQTYQQLLQFSSVSSFAIWADTDAGAPHWPQNENDFAQYGWEQKLKRSAIIIGINRVGDSQTSWDNFHYPSCTDRNLFQTFGPEAPLAQLSGAYITDLLKDVRGSSINYHHVDDSTLKRSARMFELEMQILGFDQIRPRFLVVLGSTTYWWLNRMKKRACLQLPSIANIMEIYHPSPKARVSTEKRIEKIDLASHLLSQVMQAHRVTTLE